MSLRDRIRIRRTIRKHRADVSPSFNRTNKISCQDPSTIQRVRKVSRFRRHLPLQIKQQHPSVKEIDSRNPVYATVPSLPNNQYSVEKELTNVNDHPRLVKVRYVQNAVVQSICRETQANDVEEDDRQRPFAPQLNDDLFGNKLSFKQTSWKTDYIATNSQSTDYTKSMPAKKHTLETTPVPHHSNVQTNNTDQFHNGIPYVEEQEILRTPRRNPTNENNLKPKKMKMCRDTYYCRCQPLRMFLFVSAVLLLLSVIAAVLIAFIIPANVSSSTITSTTTSVTTTTTSTTSTSSTSTSTTTSSTSTSTTTSSTSTSTTATTSRPVITITNPGDLIVGVYNTLAGQSTGSSNGTHSGASETPDKAIDGLLNTKYLIYDNGGSGGVNTGFYVTPAISNASVATALHFATGSDAPERDPLTVTLEGTNDTALDVGSSWTLIYSGSTGIHLTIVPSRSTYVPQQTFSNTIAYRSYRLLVTSKRTISAAVQYAESKILGYA